MHVTLGGRYKSKETRKNQSDRNKSFKNYKYKTNKKNMEDYVQNLTIQPF